MRQIRLLILLLALSLALVLALLRPLQGRATSTAQAAKLVQSPVPMRHLFHHTHRAHHAAHTFGNHVVSYARRFLGVRYSWGGSSPRTGFDCSGLVRYVYRRFGISLPHSTWGDLSHGHRVARRSLRPGDLVFFYGASHVGIYVGNGRFIDAPHTGARVRISTMGAYSGYYGARRFRAS
ncbi:MAG TPA: C40 family peptidase [Gaiellaceae bacterium]|nr:C40 family peptidase [Gaiellaceae bacterium]